MLSVHIQSVDFCIVGTAEPPTLVIFGLSEAGQKTQVVIPDVYPYFFVQFPNSQASSRLQQKVERHIARLIKDLNHASEAPRVFSITPVQAIPFYPFQNSQQIFLKIRLFRPSDMRSVVNLLKRGRIMNIKYSVYEDHLPFVLQFMADYNLSGFGTLVLDTDEMVTEGAWCRVDVSASRILNPRAKQYSPRADLVPPSQQTLCPFPTPFREIHPLVEQLDDVTEKRFSKPPMPPMPLVLLVDVLASLNERIQVATYGTLSWSSGLSRTHGAFSCQVAVDPEDAVGGCVFLPDEETVILRLIESILSTDPDIVCCWSPSLSSFRILERRALLYGIRFMERISRPAPSTGALFILPEKHAVFHVTGRCVRDVEYVFMQFYQPMPLYTLESLSQTVLGESLSMLSRRDLAALSTPDMLRYCLQHTERALDVCQRSGVFSLIRDIANLTGLDIRTVLDCGKLIRVESLITRECKARDMLQCTNSAQSSDISYQPERPFLLSPDPVFLSDDPLAIFDFKSLYPSVIVGFNLCYSTFIPRKSEPDWFDPLTARHPSFVPIEKYTGVLPSVLGALLELRSTVTSTNSDNPEAKRMALKLLANTTYGYLASKDSRCMGFPYLANLVVSIGTLVLDHAMKQIKGLGRATIYADTDSLFVPLKGLGPGLTEIITAADAISSVVGDSIGPRFCLVLVKVYIRSLFVATKQYAGWSVNPELPHDAPTLDVVGFVKSSRDSPLLVQGLVLTCLRSLFNIQEEADAVDAIKAACVAVWKEMQCTRPNEHDLVFTRPSARVDQPGPDSIPFSSRRSQLQVSNTEGGQDTISGEDYIANRHRHDLDWLFYINRKMIPLLSRIFAPLGIDFLGLFQRIPKRPATIPLHHRDQVYWRTWGFLPNMCKHCSRPLDGKHDSISCAEKVPTMQSRVEIAAVACQTCLGFSLSPSLTCLTVSCPTSFSRVNDLERLRWARPSLSIEYET